MAQDKKVKTSMTVKVKNIFKSPLTNRMLKVDEIVNVPKGRFWFKRIKDGDVVEVKSAKKVKPETQQNNLKDKSKGSK